MTQVSNRKIVAATFTGADEAGRAAVSLAGALAGSIGNTALLVVLPDGRAKFVESKDWGAGRGALVGGTVGLIGGPLGVLAGGALGVLASKLRDAGFPDDQLEGLGRSLEPNSSALVMEIGEDEVPKAQGLLAPLGARKIVVQDVGASVSALFDDATWPAPLAR